MRPMAHPPVHPRRPTRTRVAHLLLLAWIALGAVHTGVSLVRQGFPPARPPALGIAVAAPHEDVAALDRLLEGVGERTVFLAVPPAADTSEVLYLRYQLAHLRYPTRVLAGRVPDRVLREPGDGFAGDRPFDLLVTRGALEPSGEAEPSARERGRPDPVGPPVAPEGWRPVEREGDYVLWERPSP